MANTPELWFSTPLKQPQARLRLFCFPGAGAGGAMFRAWGPPLGPDVEVWGGELPGHWKRIDEPLVRAMEPLVAGFTEAMRPALDKPYALFGFSMGALVAFEAARALRRQGAAAPRHLFVAGRFAPDVPFPGDPLHLRADASFVEGMGQVYGLPENMTQDADLLRLIVPMMRADMQLLETYEYRAEPPFDCPMSGFAGDRDPAVQGALLEGWAKHTTGGFQSQRFPGPHHFLERNTDGVVRAIKTALR
jgi:medium-chain acyl-[acyl-carrier-protein] hydrolase